MSSVRSRLRWTSGSALSRGRYYIAVKFNATDGEQYGNFVLVRFPSSVKGAIALLTEQMELVAAVVEGEA